MKTFWIVAIGFAINLLILYLVSRRDVFKKYGLLYYYIATLIQIAVIWLVFFKGITIK